LIAPTSFRLLAKFYLFSFPFFDNVKVSPLHFILKSNNLLNWYAERVLIL